MDISARQRDWYEGLPATPVAAYAFITDDEDRILLVKPTYMDCWLFPGGVVEAGESPADGAAREAKEELGLSLPPGRLLAAESDRAFGYPDWPLLVVTVDFGSPRLGPVVLPSDELSDWGWFSVTEAQDVLSQYDRHRPAAALAARAASAV